MSGTIAGDILDNARGVYMNDPSAGTYTNDKLLPHLRTAYDFLQSALRLNGVQCKNEESVHIIPADSNELYPLPPDLVIPRVLSERTVGSSEEYNTVSWYPNIPTVTPSTTIDCWTWRVDRIFINTITVSRQVKLFYQQSFPAINNASVNLFGMAEQYLAAKTAALALAFISQSMTLAKAANDIAEMELSTLINEQVKIMQKSPSRRQPYIPGYGR